MMISYQYTCVARINRIWTPVVGNLDPSDGSFHCIHDGQIMVFNPNEFGNLTNGNNIDHQLAAAVESNIYTLRSGRG